MENTLPLQTRLLDSRLVLKLALFCAMILAMLGAPTKSEAQTMTLNNADARQFAAGLVKTTGTQDKLNTIAKSLIKYLGDNLALQVARVICYNGINTTVAARVLYCAMYGGSVKVYTLFWIPYWADRA